MTLPGWFILLAAIACNSAVALDVPRQNPVPGGIVLIPLNEDSDGPPEVRYNERRIMVLKNENQWQALVGVPLDASAGEHAVTVHYPNRPAMSLSFSVQDKDYETQHLTIKDKRMVEPTAEDLKRIGKESALIEAAFKRWSKQPADLNFILPAHGPISSPFGLRRFFNGQPRKPHAGLDIAAPKGAIVRAPAEAEVIATGNFFFNGNTVLLDHGQGLISMFNHLDRIDVNAGQRVEKNTILGLVGSTGRATGPHLHWTLVLNEARIDPALFFSEQTLTTLTKPALRVPNSATESGDAMQK